MLASRGGASLLQLHGCAGLLELIAQRLGVLPGEGFLDGVRGLVHEGLGLLEAETGGGAHLLDDLYLLRAGGLEDDVELGLLLLGRRRAVAGRRGRRGRRERRRRHAELLLEHLDEFGDLQNGLLLDRLHYLLVAERHTCSS